MCRDSTGVITLGGSLTFIVEYPLLSSSSGSASKFIVKYISSSNSVLAYALFGFLDHVSS